MEHSLQSEEPDVSIVSLGMVVLDKILLPGKPPLIDIVGGSGAYCTLGARLFAGGSQSKQIGQLVRAGKDFPERVESQLRNWGTSLVFQKDDSRSSTRGLLEYEDDTFGPKKFRYLAEPIKATPSDLKGKALLGAKAYHFLGTPEEICQQVPELLSLRLEKGIQQRPTIIWEPIPISCRPSSLKAFFHACKLTDIFSPNHLEIAALFKESVESNTICNHSELDSFARRMLDEGVGPEGKGIVIIRAGEHGSLAALKSEGTRWLPPYYRPFDPKVKDPTGAGNAFLGGFAIGLQETGNVWKAAGYGTVAASFALEQIGLPVFEERDGHELWNGSSVMARLKQYESREPSDD